MKKIISLLIVAAVILSLSVAAFAATQTATISGSYTAAVRGGQASVSFSISEAQFTGYGMTVSYDTSALELVSLSAGGASCGNFTPNVGAAFVTDASSTCDTPKSGTLFTATFNVKPGAAFGNHEVKLISDGVSYIGEPLTISLVPGTVHIHGNVTPVAAKAATCIDKGNVAHYVCDCGGLFEDAACTVSLASAETAIDPNNHVGTLTFHKDDATNHWQICSACGKEASAKEEHKWGAGWKVTTAATETTEGLEERDCSVCGRHESRKIAPLTHTHKMGDWVVVTPATCTAEGLERKYCSGCSYYEERSISKVAHEPEAKWSSDADNHWHVCKNCGTKVDIAAHKWSAWKADADNHWHVCEDCGMKAHVGAHDFHWVIDKAATKTEEGWRHQECRVCFYELAGEVIPAGKDDVPQTGDITPHITMTVLAMVSMLGAVAYVFKRKAAK